MFYFRDPLIKLMKRNKTDQVKLVKESGISQGVVTKLMSHRGCESVNLTSLDKLCQALNTNTWLLIKKATPVEAEGK